MMSIKRMIGVVGVGLLLATSLSGCDLRPLPDEERYHYIDNVLEAIDYKTVGNIVKEEIDDGDGVFSPSYKVISYGNDGSFEELEKRLSTINENCKEIQDLGQITCSFPSVTVMVFDDKKANNKSKIDSIISINDSASGRHK